MILRRAPWLASVFALALGCGARTSLSSSAAGGCPAAAPICVESAADPCDAATTVPAACDEAAHAWSCPAGARIYARAAGAPGRCLPFHATPGLAAVGGWGLGAMTRVPTDDGRCLWIADSAVLGDGAARNVALAADPTAPFGSCPSESVMPPTAIVTVEGGGDPSLVVQINGGYRLAGETHVLYRLFRVDPNAVFGVTELGGGVGRWDPTTQRIVVHGPGDFPWGLDLDLGDAALVADGEHAFVWGCARQGPDLAQGCELARLDTSDAVEILSKADAWVATTDASQGATLFVSGAWTSSVVPWSGGLRHVFAANFGDRIQSQVAADATGPWTDGPDLGPCDLPADDPRAFCAGPIVHRELADPTRPDELPVTYGVGTTGDATGVVDDYWPRLVWAP